MAFEGTVVDGKVIFDAPTGLPEGTRVEVVVRPATEGPPTLGQRLNRLAGIAKGLPADLAAEHDHYIHGTPRRRQAQP